MKEDVEILMKFVTEHIENKGFIPNFREFPSVERSEGVLRGDTNNRIDLFLSDNNLGAGEKGVDFYIKLADTGIHDFVLYTRDSQRSIVTALVEKLQNSGNPNLFSRFTFVHRESDDSWLESIEDILDHILSKREEINNLRGLYAQEMSKVENALRNVLSAHSRDDLATLIDDAFKAKKIDIGLKRTLHSQRHRRNGIIHNDEEFCEQRKKWFVTYLENGRAGKITKIYENDFSKIRNELAEVVGRAIKIL